MELMQPYTPTSDRPWNRARAGHLLRRVGFGATMDQIDRVVEDGPAAMIDRIMRGVPESSRYRDLDDLSERVLAREDIAFPAGWWAMRMVHTANPLRARMALLWHDHFATSNRKVSSPLLMLRQLRTIERYGLDSFGALLKAMSRDPAMIIWLDTQVSRNGAPNENYARELFELFSLGVGHYTEDDIRQAARAFTGWRVRDGRAFFTPRLHDAGDKTVFGRTGAYGLDDIVDRVLEQPACARFVARRLMEGLAYPVPEDEAVEAVAGRLRETDYSIAEAVEMILRSEAFFSDRAYRAIIKSPVDFAVGAIRALEARVDGQKLARGLGQMGQTLFEPPSVKGWDGGRSWINSATMTVRINAAAALTRASEEDARFDAEAFVDRYGLSDSAAVRRFVVDLLLDGQAAPAFVSKLDGAIGSRASLPAALREAVYLVLASPEYQLG